MDYTMEFNINFANIVSRINDIALKQNHCIIAIDGMCGSGKSTLAKYLANQVAAQVFHMDDFYVPSHLKTKERLNTPGSNVHYERFLMDVLKLLAKKQTVYYKPYNCATESFLKPSVIPYHTINIIEGSYSMHPELIDYYDLKIFLTTANEVQQTRIANRNGLVALERFNTLWIPLENAYFDAYHIQTQADFVLDMSAY